MGSSDPFWAGSGVERRIDLGTDHVFATLTDLVALPLWAHDVAAVADVPAVLQPGSSWRTIRRSRGRARHDVRSIALAIDPVEHRFAHHSRVLGRGHATAYSEWRWECLPGEHGDTRARVSWVLRPAFGGPFVLMTERRDHQLHAAMLEALDRLEQLCRARAVQVTRFEPARPRATSPAAR